MLKNLQKKYFAFYKQKLPYFLNDSRISSLIYFSSLNKI